MSVKSMSMESILAGMDPKLAEAISAASAGATATDDAARRSATSNVAKMRRQRLEAFRDSLPAEDVDLVVRGQVDTIAYQRVTRWLKSNSRFLWLVGPAGTGKTVAIATVVAELGGVVVLGADLVRMYRFDSVSNINERHRIERCSVLVLDDLGTKDRDHEQDALFTVVNKRQSVGRRTLMTGNFTIAEVNAYDARILSRVRGQGAVVEVAGDDMRIHGRRPS